MIIITNYGLVKLGVLQEALWLLNSARINFEPRKDIIDDPMA